MTNRRRLTLLLLVITSLSGFTACSDETVRQEDSGGERELHYDGSVHFLDSDGDTLTTLRVAIADTEESRRAGLMNVQALPENHGMLFLFEREEPLSFWMANTPLSLDILFVNEAGEIVRIHTQTQPYSNQSLASGEPARYAVEAEAGFVMNHDIREGERMVFERESP